MTPSNISSFYHRLHKQPFIEHHNDTSMKLFFIRHGETVDNVAGRYAGVRDSALTNHGVDQASKLGSYLAQKVAITHIFCSTLSRAIKTADAVRNAQLESKKCESKDGSGLELVKLPELMEQDFGFYEGKPFFARTDAKRTGKDGHYDKHRNDPGFVDVESRASMAQRADAFLDQHLLPLMLDARNDDGLAVAIVSHGILLSNLWKRLLLRLQKKSLTISPEVTASRGPLVLEHLGSWSNTGYLELHLRKQGSLSQTLEQNEPVNEAVAEGTTLKSDDGDGSKLQVQSSSATAAPKMLTGWSTTIVAIDSVVHLAGLKRQRGGIGRLAFDAGQKKLDAFFVKRQRRE